MQKSVGRRRIRAIAKVLGLSFSSALFFTILIAIRHMLKTPMRLESPLTGESHYYKWKHGYIFYKVLGAPDAPPLLLLHSPGFAASAYEMRKMLEPLAQHYHVFAPDLIGFGISDRPTMAYSADIYITLCQDFLTDIIKQPATVVASRIGCNYAVVMAATLPNLCKYLVLISPAALEGGQEQVSFLPLQKIKFALVNAWQGLVQAAPVKWLVYPILSTRFALRSGLIKQLSKVSDVDLDYFYSTTHQMGAEHASMALLSGKLVPDVSQQLELIQQPMLVIWGDRGLNDSRHIGSQQNVSWMKAHTRLALLSDAGLAVHEEQPERVMATILSWSKEDQVVATIPEENASTELYCAKCKMKRKMINGHEVTLKDGRKAVRGTCAVCGSNFHRYGRLKQQSSAQENSC